MFFILIILKIETTELLEKIASMNCKKLLISGLIVLPTVLSNTFAPKIANAATRVRFARGSYCGSYSGNFSGGREFVLGLGTGQTFTTRNTGGGVQYDISVYVRPVST